MSGYHDVVDSNADWAGMDKIQTLDDAELALRECVAMIKHLAGPKKIGRDPRYVIHEAYRAAGGTLNHLGKFWGVSSNEAFSMVPELMGG